MAKNNWIKRHPIWAGIIGIIVLFILIGIFIGEGDSSNTLTSTSNQNTNTNQQFQNAINMVSPSLTGLSDLNIDTNDLEVIENPKGEGVFVYISQTRFSGVERSFIWVVIENKAYALNGATKDLTPNLEFPRDADDQVWQKTNLNKYSASEAIEIVFG